MPEGSAVHIEKFARAYADSPAALPPGADTYHDAEDGYYFKLHLDDVTAEEATPLLSKARETFDVEIVRRVTKNGFYKERVYVEEAGDVPEGYKVEQGPAGGIYYETGVEDVASIEPGGGESRQVAVIHWEDVDVGDEIIYQTAGGEEVFAPISDIESQDDEDVIHVDVDGQTERAVPGTYEVDRDLGKAEGSDGGESDGGDATHNARHSEIELPDVCRLCDNEREEGSMVCEECADDVEKGCDGHHIGPYTNGVSVRLEDDEIYCEESGEVYEDVEIDGVVGACPYCDEMVDLAKLIEQMEEGEETEKDCDGHHERDGHVWCDETGEAYLPDIVESNNEVCPGCGEDVNVVGLMTEKGFDWLSDDDLAKADGTWVSYVGPKGGQGWVNMQTGEKRYQKERPGEAPEGHEEPDFADGWSDPPDSFDSLLPGQTVEVEVDDGEEREFIEAETTIADDGELALQSDEFSTEHVWPEHMEGLGMSVTSVEEIGDDHPADPEMVSLNPSVGNDFASQFEHGDTVALDTSEVSIIDEPVKEFEVMGYVQEGYSQGSMAVYPTEEFFETNQDATHVAVGEDEYLAPEEAEELLNGTERLEEMGLAMGDEVYLDDEMVPGYLEAEVVEPVDGRIAFETDDGATYFNDQEEIDLVTEYEYDPEDFAFDGDWEMSDAEVTGAAWIDGEPRRIASTPHPDDNWLTVQTADGTTTVDENEVDAVAPADGTPPNGLEWWNDEPIEDDEPESEGSDEPDEFEGNNLSTVEGYQEPTDFEVGQTVTADLIDGAPVDQAEAVVTDTETNEYADHKNMVEFEIQGGELDGEVLSSSMTNDATQIVGVGESDAGGSEGETIPTHTALDDALDDSSGTGPSEDEMDSAVAESPDEESETDDVHPAEQIDYDLESYSPDDVDEYRDMSDIGANHGNSVSAMDVAVLPDGSKMVEKDVGHHSVTQDDIERELAGYEAGKHLTDNIPTHAADLNAGWAASEVVPGVDAKDATDEMKEAVETGDFVEMAAVQVMIGNTDLHQNNVRVDEEGNLYPFDLDRAAGDVTGDWVGNLSQYDDSLDRMLGELEKAATALDVDTGYGFREAVIEEAQQISGDIDGPTLDLIHSEAAEANEEHAETIRENIARLGNGEINL